MKLPRDTYAGRILLWRMPGVDDDRRFPVRTIARSPSPIQLPVTDRSIDAVLGDHCVGGVKIGPGNLDDFLAANATTSLIIVSDGAIACERYFDGAGPGTPIAAFSVTKSFLSALVGIAIDRGLFGSVADPITDYVPELGGRGYGEVRLGHLLSMSEGLRYSHASVPWSGAARAYYAPDRWAAVLDAVQLTASPGTVFNYNDYAPTILGVALRRASGQHLADFAKEALLDPLGMPDPAHWTLDSVTTGLEMAAAGLYASPRTFAAFGQAHLDRGRFGGRQVIPADWIERATVLQPTDPSPLRDVKTRFFSASRMSYKYLWWIKGRETGPDDFVAIGKFGQFIYCSPATRTVAVRTGRKCGRFGATNWIELLERIAHQDQTKARAA